MRTIKLHIIIFICCSFFATEKLWAQDPQFGHFYTNAMLYNPAFAGNVDYGRFALSYRNQWPGIQGNFVSYAASYEMFFDEMHSGVGLQIVSDRAGSGGLTNNSANFMYSYHIKLNRDLAISGGIKAGVQNRFFDFNKFTFADQIARDDAPASLVNDFRDKITFGNFGTGAVLYHFEKYWLGVSFDHINNPRNGFSDDNSRLNTRTAIQAGWNFPINKGYGGNSNAKLTLATLYKAQKKWDQLDLGAYYRTDDFIFGLWYRGLPIKSNAPNSGNSDAVMLLAGFNVGSFSFAYSYDITISQLAMNTNGSHEISIMFDYPHNKRKRRKRFFTAPCPKF